MKFARKVTSNLVLALAMATTLTAPANIASAQQSVQTRVQQAKPRVTRPAKSTRKKPARKPTRKTERKSDQPVEVTGGFG